MANWENMLAVEDKDSWGCMVEVLNDKRESKVVIK